MLAFTYISVWVAMVTSACSGMHIYSCLWWPSYFANIPPTRASSYTRQYQQPSTADMGQAVFSFFTLVFTLLDTRLINCSLHRRHTDKLTSSERSTMAATSCAAHLRNSRA